LIENNQIRKRIKSKLKQYQFVNAAQIIMKEIDNALS